jgi:MFS family permease
VKPSGPLLAFAAFGAYWGVWAVVVPDVKEQTGASVTEFGVALFAVAAAALPAMILTGRLVDRRGPGLVAPVLVAYGIAAVFPGLVDSVLGLAVALAVIGALSGALDVGINVAASTVETTGGPRIMQAAHALFSGGFLVAAIASGLARSAGVEPATLLLGSGIVLVVTAWFNRAYPPVRRAAASSGFHVSWPLVALGAVCAVAFVVEGGIESWSALFLETVHDASPAVGGLGPGLFAAAMVTGRVVGQRMEGRIGGRRLLVGGGLVAACGLGLTALSPAPPVALLGLLLGGAGVSIAAPTVLGAAGRSASPERRGSSVATVTTIAYLGFIVGPPAFGAVSGAIDLRAGMALLAALALVLAAAAARAPGLGERGHP